MTPTCRMSIMAQSYGPATSIKQGGHMTHRTSPTRMFRNSVLEAVEPGGISLVRRVTLLLLRVLTYDFLRRDFSIQLESRQLAAVRGFQEGRWVKPPEGSLGGLPPFNVRFTEEAHVVGGDPRYPAASTIPVLPQAWLLRILYLIHPHLIRLFPLSLLFPHGYMLGIRKNVLRPPCLRGFRRRIAVALLPITLPSTFTWGLCCQSPAKNKLLVRFNGSLAIYLVEVLQEYEEAPRICEVLQGGASFGRKGPKKLTPPLPTTTLPRSCCGRDAVLGARRR